MRSGGMLNTFDAAVLIKSQFSLRQILNRDGRPVRLAQFLYLFALLGALTFVPGCKRFQREQHETVYVSARQIFLHDRIAAVSERVGMVTNGQKLEVLDRNRRFLKVKTEKNEVGWIEQRSVIDNKTYQAFAKLAEDHKNDPRTTTGTLRDDLYMHVTPGRDTDRLYLLPGNDKVDLLARASAPKVTGPGAAKPATTADGQSGASPAMEDWWLVRDKNGHVGWMLTSRLYVDIPDEVAQYGENQRFIGCWMLTKVNDPEAQSPPDHQVPVYLTAMAPNKAGMPFDFDQIRVFTWSIRHHRYETGFRLRPIQGFLPVRVTTEQTPAGPVPTFSFQIAGSGDVKVDPDTGIMHPANPRTITYQLIDTRAKRVGPDLAPIPGFHDANDKPSKAARKSAGKKRR